MEIFYDKLGYQIYPGDLLRVFHFISASRRERRYMYKLVVEKDGALYGVCTTEIAIKGLEKAHSYRLKFNAQNDWLTDSQIIQGDGPGDLYCYRQRPKKSKDS